MVALDEGAVWVERKARRFIQVREGLYQARPIGSGDAEVLLRALVAGTPDKS